MPLAAQFAECRAELADRVGADGAEHDAVGARGPEFADPRRRLGRRALRARLLAYATSAPQDAKDLLVEAARLRGWAPTGPGER